MEILEVWAYIIPADCRCQPGDDGSVDIVCCYSKTLSHLAAAQHLTMSQLCTPQPPHTLSTHTHTLSPSRPPLPPPAGCLGPSPWWCRPPSYHTTSSSSSCCSHSSSPRGSCPQCGTASPAARGGFEKCGMCVGGAAAVFCVAIELPAAHVGFGKCEENGGFVGEKGRWGSTVSRHTARSPPLPLQVA